MGDTGLLIGTALEKDLSGAIMLEFFKIWAILVY